MEPRICACVDLGQKGGRSGSGVDFFNVFVFRRVFLGDVAGREGRGPAGKHTPPPRLLCLRISSHLRHRVAQSPPHDHVPRARQRERHRRVEVRAGDVGERVDDRDQRKAVGRGRGRVLRGGGAAEDLEEQGAEELGDEAAGKGELDLARREEQALDVLAVFFCFFCFGRGGGGGDGGVGGVSERVSGEWGGSRNI